MRCLFSQFVLSFVGTRGMPHDDDGTRDQRRVIRSTTTTGTGQLILFVFFVHKSALFSNKLMHEVDRDPNLID